MSEYRQGEGPDYLEAVNNILRNLRYDDRGGIEFWQSGGRTIPYAKEADTVNALGMAHTQNRD